MATYQIWADIVEVSPGRFFVTVSAVPKNERTQDRTGGVKTAEGRTLEEAKALRDQLVLDVGKGLRARGHVILDLIDDDKKA
ncbi:MAG TPA: hypothetical protein VKR38_13610 [Usitatibacter sp.]|nr:hypothetical protein [Usitatibacter sp.]